MITADFIAYAARLNVSFKGQVAAEDLRGLVSKTITDIALSCVKAGSSLIGHIKCIAEVESGKFVACSVVSHDGKAKCLGELDGSHSLVIVINVLLYGLDREKVERIVFEQAKKVMASKDGKVELEDLAHEDARSCEHDENDHAHEHEHHH